MPRDVLAAFFLQLGERKDGVCENIVGDGVRERRFCLTGHDRFGFFIEPDHVFEELCIRTALFLNGGEKERDPGIPVLFPGDEAEHGVIVRSMRQQIRAEEEAVGAEHALHCKKH